VQNKNFKSLIFRKKSAAKASEQIGKKLAGKQLVKYAKMEKEEVG